MNTFSPFVTSQTINDIQTESSVFSGTIPTSVSETPVNVSDKKTIGNTPYITPDHAWSEQINRSEIMLVIKKTEQVITALYMLTDLWDNVSMRTDVRDMTEKLLKYSCNTVMEDIDISETLREYQNSIQSTEINVSEDVLYKLRNTIRNVSETCECLLSYLLVAHQYRYVSLMNLQVLETQVGLLVTGYNTIYQGHVKTIRDIRQTVSDLVRDINNNQGHDTDQQVTTSETLTRDTGIQLSDFFTDVPDNRDTRHEVMNHITSDDASQISDKKIEKTVPQIVYSVETLTDRQRHIRDIIKYTGDVSVNHIAEMFPEMSKKTLQRDLNILILCGVIERTGDKRWAVYRVV